MINVCSSAVYDVISHFTTWLPACLLHQWFSTLYRNTTTHFECLLHPTNSFQHYSVKDITVEVFGKLFAFSSKKFNFPLFHLMPYNLMSRPVVIYFIMTGMFCHVGLLRSRVWIACSTNATTTCGVWASAPSLRGWRCPEVQTGSPSPESLWSMWWTLMMSWWRDSSSFTPMPFCLLR